MSLVVSNITASDIVIDDLGLTIPANDIYDLSFRQVQAVSGSQQLADQIVSGNVVVTADTMNVLANATGYTMVISGDPGTRPASPPNGTMRHNSNTNVVEVYQSGAWQSMPNLQNVLFAIDSTQGVLCYYDPIRGKYLGVAVINALFANPNSADKSWLYINNGINHSQAGYLSPINGTITNMIAYTDATGIDKAISIWVNNTETTNAVVFTGAQNANATAANIDFSPGDTVRMRINNIDGGSTPSAKLGAVYVTVFFSVRGTV